MENVYVAHDQNEANIRATLSLYVMFSSASVRCLYLPFVLQRKWFLYRMQDIRGCSFSGLSRGISIPVESSIGSALAYIIVRPRYTIPLDFLPQGRFVARYLGYLNKNGHRCPCPTEHRHLILHAVVDVGLYQ